MKSLGILLISLVLIAACNQNTPTQNTNSSNLTDTLKFRRIVLQVEGMTCEGCETTIAKEVGKIDGVAEVKASHLDSIATIMFDTSRTNVVMISEKINGLGYKVVSEVVPE